MDQNEKTIVIKRKINGKIVDIGLTDEEVADIIELEKNDELSDRVEEGLIELLGEGEAGIFLAEKSDLYMERLLDKVVEFEEELQDDLFPKILRAAIYEANKLAANKSEGDFVFSDDLFSELDNLK